MYVSMYVCMYVFQNVFMYVTFIRWFDKRDTAYLDMGEEYAQWFTKYLGTTTRLGFSHPLIDRQINPKFIYNQGNFHPKTKVS